MLDSIKRPTQVVAIAGVVAVLVGALATVPSLGQAKTTVSAETGGSAVQTAAVPNEADLVTIDAGANETFTAVSENAALTGKAAFLRYAHVIGSSVADIPPVVTARLGRLHKTIEGRTDGIASNKGELVWAFTMAGCQPALGVPQGSAAPKNCTHWLFLDANDGTQIDETWTQ